MINVHQHAPRIALACLATLLLLSACASGPSSTEARYRLDPVTDNAKLPIMPAALEIKVTAPAWLDEDHFFYSLQYNDPSRIRRYTQSFWLSRPATLVEERLRLSWLATQKQATVRPALPGLRLDIQLLDFSQQFSSPLASNARISALVRLMDVQQKIVRAEQLFTLTHPATGVSAAAGAHALSAASDQLTASVFEWVQKQAPAP